MRSAVRDTKLSETPMKEVSGISSAWVSGDMFYRIQRITEREEPQGIPRGRVDHWEDGFDVNK